MMEKISFTKILAIGIPLLILIYFFYLVVFNVPQTYTIDIGTEGDVDSGKDAYLRDLTAQGRLSVRMSIEDDTFRNMTGSPVYFHVTPKNRIFNDTIITAELKFRGDADLDIGVYKAYAWKPLYVKSLENYTPVKRFDDVVIYTKDNSSNYTDYDTINEWISGNIPKYSSIGLYDYKMDPSILINRNLTFKNAYTEINQTFRGTHTFLVYLKDSLNLTLGKQDMNWYNGSDAYSVELYNDNGSLILNDTMQDDGINDDSKRIMPPQFKLFFQNGIKEGLYELRLVNVREENKYDDSTITSIKINTDKIVTMGNILPINPGSLFFESKRNSTLKFNVWQMNAVQNITILGTVNKEFAITEDLLNKWVSVELPPGTYTMSTKSNLYISGMNFAFSKDSFFQPYNYVINRENSDWVIITNYHVDENQNGWLQAKKTFKGLELLNNKTILFGLRKIEENEVMLNEFKVTLTSR